MSKNDINYLFHTFYWDLMIVNQAHRFGTFLESFRVRHRSIVRHGFQLKSQDPIGEKQRRTRDLYNIFAQQVGVLTGVGSASKILTEGLQWRFWSLNYQT